MLYLYVEDQQADVKRSKDVGRGELLPSLVAVYRVRGGAFDQKRPFDLWRRTARLTRDRIVTVMTTHKRKAGAVGSSVDQRDGQ